MVSCSTSFNMFSWGWPSTKNVLFSRHILHFTTLMIEVSRSIIYRIHYLLIDFYFIFFMMPFISIKILGYTINYIFYSKIVGSKWFMPIVINYENLVNFTFKIYRVFIQLFWNVPKKKSWNFTFLSTLLDLVHQNRLGCQKLSLELPGRAHVTPKHLEAPVHSDCLVFAALNSVGHMSWVLIRRTKHEIEQMQPQRNKKI